LEPGEERYRFPPHQGIRVAWVAADEMPNFPHLEFDQSASYATAKIKDTLLAVTGR
jgi:hypothetical protein